MFLFSLEENGENGSDVAPQCTPTQEEPNVSPNKQTGRYSTKIPDYNFLNVFTGEMY